MRTLAGVHTQQVSGAAGTEYSIWAPTAFGTAAIDDSNNNSVCIGTKFRTNTNGSLVAIMWQRPNSGAVPYEVALFQGTTNLSGTTTVTGATNTGWQRMNFGTAVSVTSGTIYTAALRCHSANDGTTKYYATGSYFNSARTNGPLEAVATTVSANGVYTYSATMVAPSLTFSAGSYFIDVVFVA